MKKDRVYRVIFLILIVAFRVNASQEQHLSNGAKKKPELLIVLDAPVSTKNLQKNAHLVEPKAPLYPRTSLEWPTASALSGKKTKHGKMLSDDVADYRSDRDKEH